ncbi:hypothetical protein [Vibrio stylophorae]|nr:hypothetical protein [Vibrio stylophorae]
MLTLFSFLCSIPLLASTFALYWQVEHLLPGFIAVKSVMREQSWFYFSFIFILYTLISFTVLYIIYRCLSRRVAYQVQHQYRAS